MKTFFVTIQLATLSILLGVVTVITATPVTANAKTKAKVQKQAKKSAQKSADQKSLPSTHLSTDIHFDALTLNGRHQSPFGVTSVVEAEKETPTLVDYRKDFSDRMARANQGR